MKATIVFLFVCASLLRAQLPSAPNALDADGLRHGEWIIYYDAEWNPVNDPDSAAFYREIVYEHDKPVGPVIDRYPDGSKQWEATLLADRPEDVIHGDAIWYHDDGSVSIRAPFKNGLRHGVRKEYDENGSVLFTGGFVEDRPDGWHVRMNAEGDTLAALEYDDGVAFTLVYLFTKTHERFAAGDLDSAALYGAKALAQAERESGANSEDYGTVASDVAYVEHARGNYERAERLYRAGLEVAVAVNGEESQDAAITSNNLGILLRDLGKPEEAAPLFERVLNYVKNARGADDPTNAANYFNLAGVYRDLDRYDEATPLFDTAIILLERQEPIDSVALSWYLSDAGVAAFFGGDYATAEARYLQAIDVKKRVLDETDPDYVLAFRNLDALYEQTGETKKRAAPLEEIARLVKLVDGETSVKYHAACNQLALVHDALGDYDRAVSVYRETATLMRDNPETKPSDYATVISNLGLTHKRRGDFGQAEYWLKESYRVRANNSGTDSPEAINALLNLGSFYGDVGMYRAAETAFLGAKRAVEANAPIDSATYAAVISNLGYLRHQTGDYREAEELYRRSLDIKARVVGEDDPDYALGLNNLALVYKKTGNYAEAEKAYIRANKIWTQDGESSLGALASGINNLAGLYLTMGRYEQAEEEYRRSIAILESLLPDRQLNYATTLSSLATVYKAQGAYAEAEPLYVRSLELLRDRYGDDHPNVGIVADNLAALYHDVGRHEESEALYSFSVERIGELFGETHHEYGAALNNLATLLDEMGDDAEAEKNYLEALEITRRQFGVEHPDYANMAANLARFYTTRGKLERAEPLYFEILVAYKKAIDENFTTMSEEEKTQFYETFRSKYDDFFEFAIRRSRAKPSILGDLYDGRLFSKALLFNSTQKTRRLINQSGDSTLVRDYERWLERRELISGLYALPKDRRAGTGYDLDELERDANELEKSLSERSQAFANEYVSTSATWRDVRDALAPNEAAVEFIRAPFEEDDGSRAIYYAALVVTPTTEETPALALLTDGERLEKVDVRRYRASIRNQLGEEDQAYRAFWEPVAPLLGDATRAYVSLDGVYNQISLPTLKNPKTGAYLVDELETAIVSNTKSIVERRRPPDVERRAVLVGYPDYDFAGGGGGVQGATGGTERALDGETRSSLRGVNLAPLEGTKAETAAIEELMRANGWEARALLGAVATETAVKSVDRPRALHIATHGFFVKDVERTTEDDVFGVEKEEAAERPLLRSGLFFAGAAAALNSEATFPTNDNGVLTAYEAMNMNLDGAELVALSACETGLGDVKNGEGVYGLQRAFQTAGAQSVLMSLWKVDDDATRLLMTEFYRRWLGGASKREALDAARTATRERYPEPLYWGAFTLVGG